METTTMRKFLLVVGVVTLLTLAGCVDDLGLDDDTTHVEGTLEIHHIDVGQADSTLVITPDGETILIDTGDWRQDGSDVIEYLESQGVDRVNHLVGTHPHADHIGGHAAVIEHFETEGAGIGAAYDSGVAHDSLTFDNYLDAIEAHDVTLYTVEEGDELPLAGDVSALVLNPPAGESGSDLHYNSVALVIQFGEHRYVTTGDAEAAAEERLVGEWADELDADVYQAGHHGSSTSSTPTFLDATDPDLVVISSAFDSQYGHPHDEVLQEFADRGTETYWTAVHGDVVIRSDGSDLAVETTQNGPTDGAALLEAKHGGEAQPSITAVPIEGTSAPAFG